VLKDLNNAITEAEQTAQTDTVCNRIALIRTRLDLTIRIALIRTRLDLTIRFVDYMRAIRAPFEGIDFSDSRAVAEAHEKAKAVGRPLSDELIEFCEKNNLTIDPRGLLLRAHERLNRFISRP